MTDYFGDASGAAASTNGAGQATANGGQAAMEEEIMVSGLRLQVHRKRSDKLQ